MKTLHLLIFTFLMAQFSLQGQDPQWYVWEGDCPGILNQVLLEGISPVAIDRANTRHDIFVIFEDNNFYSSRFAFPGRTGLTDNMLDDFTDNRLLIDASIAGSSAIRHLYWTNLYDDDDDPTRVSASAAGTGYGGSEFQIKEYTQTDTMVANHDILIGTDITVIIPIEKYKDSIARIKVNYNQIVDKLNNVETKNVLTLNNAISYSGNITNNSDGIEQFVEIDYDDSKRPYLFLIFHVNDTLSLTDEDGYAGRFILEETFDSAYKTIDTLEERILTSHDPNLVRVKSYCESPKGIYINYRINYFNDGEAIEDHVKISFILPDYFQLKSLCEIGSNWNGSYYDTVNKYQQSTESDSIVFYNDSARLSPRIFGDNKADGYIDFCVKLKDSNLFREFKLEEPTIYFGDQPYEITRFIQDEQLIEETPCPCNCKKRIKVIFKKRIKRKTKRSPFFHDIINRS